MDEKTLDWDDLRLFLAVAREGGLSPAARAAGSSPATLARRMLALERRLGRDLFVRHERGYAPTDEGRALLAELGEVERRIDAATAPAQAGEAPLVKISAGTWTTLHLLERIDALLGDPPDLRLRFVSAEATLDITRREVAIGFRNARPTAPALAGRRLARVEFAPYAAPGAPDGWIAVRADTPSARWLDRWAGDGAAVEVAAPRNALDLALAGRGRAVLPTFVGDAQGGLVRAGDTVPDLAHDQWIVTHQDDRQLTEVRRTIDRLVRALERQKTA